MQTIGISPTGFQFTMSVFTQPKIVHDTHICARRTSLMVHEVAK